uniref:F-box domain-containing protein n=1 Tax=Bursaphelenchus xylophilus TaxID=6326 RepID=A0A1I7RVM7_BURXY
MSTDFSVICLEINFSKFYRSKCGRADVRFYPPPRTKLMAIDQPRPNFGWSKGRPRLTSESFLHYTIHASNPSLPRHICAARRVDVIVHTPSTSGIQSGSADSSNEESRQDSGRLDERVADRLSEHMDHGEANNEHIHHEPGQVQDENIAFPPNLMQNPAADDDEPIPPEVYDDNLRRFDDVIPGFHPEGLLLGSDTDDDDDDEYDGDDLYPPHYDYDLPDVFLQQIQQAAIDQLGGNFFGDYEEDSDFDTEYSFSDGSAERMRFLRCLFLSRRTLAAVHELFRGIWLVCDFEDKIRFTQEKNRDASVHLPFCITCRDLKQLTAILSLVQPARFRLGGEMNMDYETGFVSELLKHCQTVFELEVWSTNQQRNGRKLIYELGPQLKTLKCDLDYLRSNGLRPMKLDELIGDFKLQSGVVDIADIMKHEIRCLDLTNTYWTHVTFDTALPAPQDLKELKIRYRHCDRPRMKSFFENMNKVISGKFKLFLTSNEFLSPERNSSLYQKAVDNMPHKLLGNMVEVLKEIQSFLNEKLIHIEVKIKARMNCAGVSEVSS